MVITGRVQPYPARLSARRRNRIRRFARMHVHRSAEGAGAARAIAGALPAFPLFDSIH